MYGILVKMSKCQELVRQNQLFAVSQESFFAFCGIIESQSQLSSEICQDNIVMWNFVYTYGILVTNFRKKNFSRELTGCPLFREC